MTITRDRSFGKDITNFTKEPLATATVRQDEGNKAALPVEPKKEPVVVVRQEEKTKVVLPEPKKEPVVSPEIDRRDNRDALTRAIDTNPCAKCRATRKPRCECVIILGGEAIDEGVEKIKQAELEEELEARLLQEESEKENITPDEVVLREFAALKPEELSQRTLHPELMLILADLFTKGLLVLNHNAMDGVLDFAYQYNPNEEPGDRHKFNRLMEAILVELELFQRQNNVMGNLATIMRNNDNHITSLRINFQRPAHFDKFNLLFLPQNNEQQDKRNAMSQQELDNLIMNPLSTRLTMRAGNQRKADEKEDEHHYYSPLRPRSPKDGLKLRPKGH
ncbi:MAG: hypothetical protein V4501_13040 [Pseudomonadota bacterium]